MERPLPKKLTELGRIRIGDLEANSGGRGTHPHKLDMFRLTSQNKPLLHFAANTYGGEVRPWTGERAPEGHFELYTAVNSLAVLVPVATAMTVQYEQWSGSGCTRRCTGALITHCPLQEQLKGTDCQCPEDEHERAEAAKDGKACARVCRLNVILPDLPGLGLWRLDTKGYYATAELLGALELFAMMPQQIIEASLRLEQRSVKRFIAGRDGKGAEKSATLKFVVPVLWPKFTPRQLLGTVDQRLLLMAPPAVPQITAGAAAKAADDLFGDGAGDRMRQAAVQQWIARISAAWTAYGLTPAQLDNYWAKQCRRGDVATASALSLEQCARLYAEVEAWIAAHPQQDHAAEGGALDANNDADDLPEFVSSDPE